MVNQGSGRLTRGANSRFANKRAVELHAESSAQAKRTRNRRYVVTDVATGASREVSRFEFSELSARDDVTSQTPTFRKAQQDLLAGLPVEIGGVIFQIAA